MDYYLHRCKFCLKVLSREINKIFSHSKIKFNAPDGGFYYFLDFNNYKNELDKILIYNSDNLCEKLLYNTGIALLSGSNFGRHDNDLTARLAFVDFNGEDIINKEILNEKDIIHICSKTIEGCKLLVYTLENNIQNLNNFSIP